MKATIRRARSERRQAPRPAFRSIVRALLVVSAALSTGASAQDYRPEDFLPLAVGNNWTYLHCYGNEATDGTGRHLALFPPERNTARPLVRSPRGHRSRTRLC